MLKDEKELRHQMYLYLKNKYEGVIAPSWSVEQMLKFGYNLKEAKVQLNRLERDVRLNKEMKIFDAGCGFGYFVSYCLANGYDCFGYEINPVLAKIATELLATNKQGSERIKLVNSKTLPYKNKSFDLINFQFVLDYVSDIPCLLRESKRILKDDGQIFIIVPNYQCLYSPVYALLFIPWLPKILNRVYFRLMGRPNTIFLDSLTFTTPKYLERIFKDIGLKFKNLGLRYWEDLITKKSMSGRSNLLNIIVRYSRIFKLTWVLRIFAQIGFYTPMVYVLEKCDKISK